MLTSVVTPAFNEAQNLPVLYERLAATMAALGLDWEWVVVDDHSSDGSFEVLTRLAARDPRVRGLRFARNCGSHTALACGLHHAAGACVVALAADLQDPPEIIAELLAEWRQGAQIVWAGRRDRPGETAATLAFSRLYHRLMRSVGGLDGMPASGADCFLLDRTVVDAFARFRETHTSILALLGWMGFRQATVLYDKAPRLHGTSGWTLAKKLRLVIDSVTSFSAAPIRMMSYGGVAVAGLGAVLAGHMVLQAIVGTPVAGWSAVLIAVLLLAGVQMVMLGTLGEYLWRALAETRRRPQYLIERATPTAEAAPTVAAALDRTRGAGA